MKTINPEIAGRFPSYGPRDAFEYPCLGELFVSLFLGCFGMHFSIPTPRTSRDH
jgi:hypothetical protein